jgi:hypothetical protein
MSEEKKFYDDGAFYVEQSRWKMWNSYDKDGKCILTSLDEERCVRATRFYLKGVQEGWEDSVTHEGTVGGKL